MTTITGGELLLKTLKNEDISMIFGVLDGSYNAWLAKLERSTAYYKTNVPDCPEIAYKTWEEAIEKIKAAKSRYGAVIAPGDYQP